MKTIFALAFLIVGISAKAALLTESVAVATDQRLVSDSIISAFEDLSQGIRDAGLDPLVIQRETYAYGLPVPVIFNAAAFLEDVLSTGLSEIIINNMNYSVLFSRLDFDIELPLIHLSARSAKGEVTLFGETLEAEADGRVDIRRIRILGRVRVYVGIISGIALRSVEIDSNVGAINTNIRLAIQGDNYSREINTFLSSMIPEILKEYKDEIDELIETVLFDILNDVL